MKGSKNYSEIEDVKVRRPKVKVNVYVIWCALVGHRQVHGIVHTKPRFVSNKILPNHGEAYFCERCYKILSTIKYEF